MRYLITFLLILPGACGILGRENKTSEPPVETVEDVEPVEIHEDVVTEDDSVEPQSADLTGPKQTVASLGDPSRPGLWLETPLVQAETQGRVRLASGGATVAVTLLPAPGEATAGSRLSLEAMRALGAPLTELVELSVSPAG